MLYLCVFYELYLLVYFFPTSWHMFESKFNAYLKVCSFKFKFCNFGKEVKLL